MILHSWELEGSMPRGVQNFRDRHAGVPGTFNFLQILAKNTFKMNTDIL